MQPPSLSFRLVGARVVGAAVIGSADLLRGTADVMHGGAHQNVVGRIEAMGGAVREADRGPQPVDGRGTCAVVGLFQEKVTHHLRRRRPYRSERRVAKLLEAFAVGGVNAPRRR